VKETIEQKLQELRTMLQGDGGDLEIVEIDGLTVRLKLTGACSGCPHAAVTLKQGIERILREQVDPNITVERVEG